jgi:hypothetical protein
VAEEKMRECYEGCPDSPSILDLCDPDTEEAVAKRNMNNAGKKYIYRVRQANFLFYMGIFI